MFHGTSRSSWRLIEQEGFRASTGGGLGPGVYVTRDVSKAENYRPSGGVIIKLRVNLGRGIVIDSQEHDLQKTWMNSGFDSAFAPAGAIGVREENCVADPDRIAILGLERGYKPPCRFGTDCRKMDQGCSFDHGGASDDD
jgi:hypothetical protein